MVKKIITIMLTLLLLCTLVACAPKKQAAEDDTLLVQYFYENVCATCHPEEEFIENFETYTGISTRSPNLVIEMYNVYEEDDRKVWDEVATEFNIDKDAYPAIRVGNDIRAMGDAKETLSSSEFTANIQVDTIPTNASVILYFSSPGCHACEDAEKQVIAKLPESYTIHGKASPIKLIKVSTAEKGSIERFRSYCETYKVPKEHQKTPIVFVGYHALYGDAISQLSEILAKGDGLTTPLLQSKEYTETSPLLDYGFLGVFLTGLLNGINPCAISMVLMLLSLLVVDKKLTVPVGLSFAVGKFVGFFLLGTVLFTVVDILPLNEVALVTKIVLLVLSAVMVLLNLNDLLAAKSERYNKIRLQLPQGLRKRNHDWIKRMISVKKRGLLIASGVLLGLIMAAGEFLCTGQIYLAVIVQVVHSGAELSGRALLYLLTYSFAFIVPLLIMVLLIAKGRKVFKLSDHFRKNMTWIKLGNMLVFALFFVLVLFLW